jgi:allantoinase
MENFDLLIRGGRVVTSKGVRALDIGVAGGLVAALEPGLAGGAEQTVDATGLHIFPGLIDSHLHFNEPGRTHWEGFETGSRALAAGGGTLFFDMPLNAHPPTIDGRSFDEKLAAARASSLVDFAFWGGLVPGNLEQLSELADRGVIGFKAFMSNSGIDDFPRADAGTLREGMKRAAALDRLVAVHAESEEMTAALASEFIAQGRTGVRDYLDSRPVRAELEAIRCAIELAGETGCSLHIVHVSCGEGVAQVLAARTAGANVTCETCPHYLALTEDDMIRLGAIAKCAPPLRSARSREGLWEHLKAGAISTVGSDHSPAPPEMKADPNFFKVWGGISGVQHTLPLMLTEGHIRRGMDLRLIAQLTSFNVAERFRLPACKRGLALGADADLALVNLSQSVEVKTDQLFYRHRYTPYTGRALTGTVVQTILRGQTVFRDGRVVSKPAGELVRPGR